MLVFGKVTNINQKDFTVKLQVPEYDNFETPWLFVPQIFTRNSKSGYMPEINSIVAAILNEDMSDGVILGSTYNDEDVVLTEFNGQEFIRFSDGSTIVHFENTLKLVAQTVIVDGDLKCTGNIQADGDVEDKKGTMQKIRDVYNSHEHPNGNNGASTGITSTKM